jgi:hypothetical protein
MFNFASKKDMIRIKKIIPDPQNADG